MLIHTALCWINIKTAAINTKGLVLKWSQVLSSGEQPPAPPFLSPSPFSPLLEVHPGPRWTEKTAGGQTHSYSHP